MCGLVTNCRQEDSIPYLEFLNGLRCTSMGPPKMSRSEEMDSMVGVESNFVLDSFTEKKKSMLLALQTADNLANIGAILQC